MLLQHVGADYDKSMIPEQKNLYDLFSNPLEVRGNDFMAKMSVENESQVRKNRSQFTAAEDNLLLRGVVSLNYLNILL